MDKKVTITFDSFNDFKLFLENPPRVKLNQITVEPKRAQYSESTKPKAAPKVSSHVPPASLPGAIVGCLQALNATEAGRAQKASKLLTEAFSRIGLRATKRNIRYGWGLLQRLTVQGKIHRARKGWYALQPRPTTHVAKKTSAKSAQKK